MKSIMQDLSKDIFSNLILEWYKENKRDFPWRYNSNPYEVLVSELFLQKTDAPKVEAIFDDFFSKFSAIEDIQKANQSELELFLKPLGLYINRAERLKSLANTIVDDFNGEVPNKKEELLELKGVGEYISNAVLCFAFDTPKPIVDSNVIRIFSRLYNYKSNKKRPRTDKEIWNFAEALLPDSNIKDFNYALLDFSSKICKARKPECDDCIFLKYCSFGKKYLSNK